MAKWTVAYCLLDVDTTWASEHRIEHPPCDIRMRLHINTNRPDPIEFARQLAEAEEQDYVVILRYYTIRADGPSQPRLLHLPLNLKMFHHRVCDHWILDNQSSLAQTARCPAHHRS